MPTALFLNPGVKPPIIRDSLASAKPESQSLINDFRSLKVTRELMSFVDRLFSASANASRRYSTSNISVTTWLDQPRTSKDYTTLLCVDPAQEPSAPTEQDNHIGEVVPKRGVIQIKDLAVQDATKYRFSYEFASGEYDMDRNAISAYAAPAIRSQSESLSHSDQGRSCQFIGELILSTGKDRFRNNNVNFDSCEPECGVNV